MELINDLIVQSDTKPILDLSCIDGLSLDSPIKILKDDDEIWSGEVSTNQSKIELAIPDGDYSNYQIEIVKNNKKTNMHFSILKLDKDEPYIICDIDFTLSATNVFLYLTENLLKIKKIYLSKEVLQELAKTTKIIYLTGRVIKYAYLTKKWLLLNGYPNGPLISRTQDVFYNLENFKKRTIEKIVKISQNGIGIGDLKSDIAAYQYNKIVPIRIIHPIISYSKKENYLFKNGCYTVNSWKGIEKLFREVLLLNKEKKSG